MIYVVFGVSGSGKTTIGKELAQRLNVPFLDADDFHPQANKDKMSQGIPLTDEDRWPWLHILASELIKRKDAGVVLACSALKQAYRDVLDVHSYITWIFLHGSFHTIKARLEQRSAHFFNPKLLQSQFDILEQPNQGIVLDISKTPTDLVNIIMNSIRTKNNLGLIGLGVMGSNLALNILDHNYSLSVYNRTTPGEEKVVADFIEEHKQNGLSGFTNVRLFVESLEVPRKVILMIPAGAALDEMISHLQPLLSPEDILIDAGNSHFKDTERRIALLKNTGIHWVGMGVSGGKKGARFGPSIMPGCTETVYAEIGGVLEAIAAKTTTNSPCCTRIGTGGAGHFVKMIHNGIEYAEMALIAELYSYLKSFFSLEAIANYFDELNATEDGSYLLEISSNILRKKEGDDYLVEQILDKAANKGTGSWSVTAALELGQPANMIAEALQSRYHSSFKAERMAWSNRRESSEAEASISLETISFAYRFARIVNHHQGFQIIRAASQAYNWNINLSHLANIWTNGCIIRSKLMASCSALFKNYKSVLANEDMLNMVAQQSQSASQLVQVALQQQLAMPVFSAAIQSWLFMSTAQSNANMIQAQRDFFGAHTYERKDNPGTFIHTEWENND